MNPLYWWIIAILFFFVVWAFLDLPMVVNAAKYAQVSREILSKHDWINLTIAGDAYEQKPPLLFWIGAVFFELFGISTVVWKVAVFLFSFIGIYSTYRLGKLLYGQQAGYLSALFWACSLSFLYYHNDIHTDTILADMVIFSIWQLALFFSNRKNIHFYLGIIGVGGAMLAKGPVGMAIPATAVGIHLLLHRRWKDIFHPRWLPATAIIAVMIFPALLGLYNQFGAEGIKFYFWTNNVGRITGSYYVQNPDPFFYLHTILYMLAPFTIFALFGMFRTVKKYILAKGRFSASDEFYLLGGILPYLLVLTVSKTKNPHYLMAVVPLFMILAANFTMSLATAVNHRKLERVTLGLNLFVSSIFWLITALFVFWFFPEKNILYWILILGFLAILGYALWRFTSVSKQIAVLTVSMLAFMFSLFFSFYPEMAVYHAPFQVAKDFNWEAAKSEQIHLYRKPSRYWEIFFYSRNPGKYFMTEDDLPRLLKEKSDWVFTDTEGKNEIMDHLPGTKIIHDYDHRSLSQMTPAFLNPRTRASKLEKRYLLHLP